ncbi:MAG: hypothetical protein E5X34_13015 [Mesorhizobium sp.]|uniref:hypothetical protein n=1 Tax=Mesorhizobium sp. TaxID=1871066 RepID=UPI001208E5FB|nr:hypothetical protein [Mesorhizobium sp.]TIR23970.1 MAG: hypothetical protein E5X34_13015 [Mesorhizobium sp.]
MTIRFVIDPRMVPPEKIARRLGVTPAVFEAKRAELEGTGFPKPDRVLGNYCLEAVDKWIDAQVGLTRADDPASAQAAMLAAVRGKAWAK